ncbi:MAG: aspartate/glutamate racemase family protein [Chloroflexi bacterium]|nr:aspartate/glutamate racemase family protein [Chloroflexota bacterium]
MKTIGLIGGLSWESSAEYYRIINQETQKRLGGLHSAKCQLYSFDFGEIEALQAADDWDSAAARMIEAARKLQLVGADGIVICSNTMHLVAEAVEESLTIPLLHIADATAEPILAAGLRTVGLLGTRFTMEQDFYRGRMAQRFGLDVKIPGEKGRAVVHDIIYEELVRGIIRDDSRKKYQDVIQELEAAGAEAVVLGCTEIGLLIKPGDCALPAYDTTLLHALAAVD